MEKEIETMPNDDDQQLNQLTNDQTKDQSDNQNPLDRKSSSHSAAEDELNIHADFLSDKNLGEVEQTDFGLVKPKSIEDEMQGSYLDYAMSVIVSRALPDVRDGLKPVHRKVLYSMHELGLSSRARYRKSATVVGDVLGKYHPHGDIAVYDTLVRLAQPFSMRYRLVDGQGNFGSMDGDGAAAMRYTEARLTALAEEMLADIDKNTVDFIPNFDGSREEPSVLPAKVPQLLLNGSLGIAVGMATNIPPHNLGELCDGLTYLIDHGEAEAEDLMQFIKGPDFPTGANIFNPEEIKNYYSTGKGKILIRAVANIEEKKSGGFRIIISQIPYQVNKAELIAKIADLVKIKKIEGISDLRDESDRKEGVRIVVELKHNAYPKKILNQLFELTPLQTTFHVNMLALIDGIQPRVLTLKNILEEFIKHRQNVVRRRIEFDLFKAKERAHILEGLKKALDHIDEIIALIKKSSTKEEAHQNLIAKFEFSDRQATAILEMRLSTLAGLERKKIDDELAEKLKLIKELEAILSSELEILKIIKNELLEIKEKFADLRRTKIISENIGQFSAEDLIPNEQVAITLTKDNYIKRVPITIYRSQNRGGKGVMGMTTKEEDIVEHLLVAMTHDDIMFFTDSGKVFVCKVFDLPAVSRQAKGQAIVNLLQVSPNEKVTAIITMDKKKRESAKYFFMGTQKGVVKKTFIDAYKNVRKSGLIAIKLQDNDRLKWVVLTNGENEIVMVTRNGQSIHFNESDTRSMGRSAAGVRGIKLRPNDEVISMDVVLSTNIEILTILENGFGKRTKINLFTIQKRGGIGIRASKVTSKTGKLVEALAVEGDEDELVIISREGQIIRMPIKSVKKLGRDTQGVTLMRLNSGDKVASITVFRKEIELTTSNKVVGDQTTSGDDVKEVGQSAVSAKASASSALLSKKKLQKLNKAATAKKNISDKKLKQKGAMSPKATARHATGGNREGKMDDSLQVKLKGKHTSSLKLPENKGTIVNEIKPKEYRDVNNPMPFEPRIKAIGEVKPAKEFVPYVKSQKYLKNNQPKPDDYQVNFYQSSNNKSRIDPKKSGNLQSVFDRIEKLKENKKPPEPNYWGKK